MDPTTRVTAPGKTMPWYDRDEMLGSFIYHYPIALPPGRNTIQPELELTYNSVNVQSGNILGAGWSLPIQTIERINKTGLEDLYDSTTFTSSLSGELVPTVLTDATHGAYGAKVEAGPFLSYVYDSSTESWTATDAQGTTYTFGNTSASRVDDPDDTTRVFTWYLSEIRDANDNVISYTYTKDGNQIYPATIAYTGNGTADGVFVVTFTLASRDDVATSYASGFEVTTDQRVSAITVTAGGVTRRTFVLSYTTGDNGVRSLLSSVLETGYEADGTSAALPETTFDYSSSTVSWTQDSAYSIPKSFVESEGYDRGVRLSDVNGDGLQDFLFANSGSSDTAVYLNDADGTGWSQDLSYTIPVRFLDAIVAADQGVRLFDVNGDGLDDFVYGESDDIYDGDTSDTREVYVNDGDGTGWTQDTTYTLPANFAKNAAPYYMYDAYTRLGDVNGDGLADILYADPYGNSAVYLNNGDGTGWTQETSYTSLPIVFGQAFGGDVRDSGVRVADVNHDGLADLVYGLIDGGSRYSGYGVYINTGDSRFTYDTTYILPEDFSLGGYDSGARLSDVNSDGFIDLVIGDDYYDENAIYLNTGDGTGWTLVSGTVPEEFTQYNVGANPYDRGVRMMDIDGDGLEDVVRADDTRSTGGGAVYIHDGYVPDLLTSVVDSKGAQTSVSYTSSVEDGVQEDLPFILQVVEHITTDDGFGNTSTESFSYEEGDYYYADEDDRQFSGFGKVTETDGVGNTTVTYIHQGNATNTVKGEATDTIAKLGRVYREEHYDSAGNLYRVQVSDWQSADLGDDRTFVYLEDELELLYDGGSTHVDRASAYTYDSATGVTLTKTEYGEVSGNDDGSYTDTGEDDRTTTTVYATDTASVITARPATVTLTDTDGTTVSQTRYTYDDLAFGSVDTGNVTQQDVWISGTDYATTSYTYDVYGNVLTSTDPLGNTTTTTYDSSHLYPATIVNALSQTQTSEYDLAIGKPTSIVEVNGAITQTDYDGFARPTEERRSSDSSATVLVTTKIWFYDDIYFPRSVKVRTYVSTTQYEETIQYLDGFDRIVETKTLDAAHTAYNESQTSYDALGRVSSTTLPQATASWEYDSTAVSSSLGQTFSYDALSRVTAVVDALGTTTTEYDGFTKTVTDALGNQKGYVTDGLDHLLSVVEYIDGATQITNSIWSGADKLTKLTDALSNVRGFTYDGRGLRLTAQDLHDSADTTYGTWVYTYDDAGDLSTFLSPNGVTVTYGYDVLNRQTTEDADDATGVEVTYTYDSCTNGTGQLCEVTTSDGVTTASSYTAAGRLSSETKTISAVSYTTSYTYDTFGNVLTTTQPDGTVITNTYNTISSLETVQKQSPTDSSGTDIVLDTDYGPDGQITSQTNGDGTVTTYTYDETQRYRLTRKVTTGYESDGTATTTSTTTTTETFYPTTGDGYISKYNASWDTAHDATSGSSATATSTSTLLTGTSKSSSYYYLYRSFLPFDTSSIPDDATVTSATLNIYPYSKKNDDNDGDDFVTVVQTSQASTTSLSTADFDQAGAIDNPTEGIDTSERKDITNITTGAYLTFNLNSTGLGWVSSTGTTKLGLREGHDVIDSAFTSSSTTYTRYNYLYIRPSEYTGTTYDPYLTVTYTQTTSSTASTPVAATLQDLTYTYDDVGNITQIVDASDVDTAKTTDYVYDGLYRLESATVSGAADGNNGTITYTYDAIGNITLRSDMGTYSYDGTDYANPHAVTSILKTDGTTATYTYDNNGNLLGDGVKSYLWDYKNRLVSSGETTTSTSTTTTTTTVSFYPTTGDGWIYKTNASWDTAHDATSGSYASSTSTYGQVGTYKYTSSYFIARSFLPFDTSSIPDDATVTAAALNVYVYSKTDDDNDGDDFVTLVQASQPSTTTLTTADYDLAGSAIDNPTEGIDTSERKDITSVSSNAYLSFTLNSAGLGWVSPTGTTKLALREGHDIIDSAFTSSSTTYSKYNRLNYRSSEYTGTAYDPYLTVTY
ncbi:VCBS repeat-containing protein, partial [Candidatus Uhrbacteria bacterium]|nr:VCBS repeat-containing protein [Candidatus Uhrbacteria bacterium]